MMIKYSENRLHNLFSKIKKLSNFYEKKYEDSSFSHLILTKKKIIWATHYLTQPKSKISGFIQTGPIV